ncbi:MAG: hypothetical protein AB7R55_07680 [Gemmatimonadales bacterium]
MMTRRLAGRLAGAICCSGLLATGAWAQAEQRAAPVVPEQPASESAVAATTMRHGMWLSAGLGAGAASLHCSVCDGEQQSRGTSGYLRIGTTVNSKLLLGAELNGWMRGASGDQGSQRVMALTGNAYWYPHPRHAYYFKGGFGVSRYRSWTTDDEDGVTDALTAGGFTGQVGIGYEVRVNPTMSIVPYFNLIGSARGALSTERDDGTHFDRDRLPTRANLLFLQLGLGMTWH